MDINIANHELPINKYSIRITGMEILNKKKIIGILVYNWNTIVPE